jgi:hypothetical protein
MDGAYRHTVLHQGRGFSLWRPGARTVPFGKAVEP